MRGGKIRAGDVLGAAQEELAHVDGGYILTVVNLRLSMVMLLDLRVEMEGRRR